MKKRFAVILIIIITLKTEAQTSVFTVIDNLMLQGNYQEALVELESIQPKTVKVFEKIGGIYQSIGNYNKAIENFKNGLEIEDKYTLKVKLGRVYNLAGLSSNSIKIYEEIISKDSTNLLVANSLGKLYLAKFRSNKAEKIYLYLERKDTINPNYPFQLGQSYMKQDKFFKMGQSYLDAYNRDSLHVKSIYRLAKFFIDLKDKDSTMIFIDKGLQIDYTNINFNQLKANALYTAKNYEGAIKHLKLLDSLNYKSAGIYEMLGMSYMKMDSLDRAESFFQKGKAMDSNNGIIYYRLANIYYLKEDFKRAKYHAMLSTYFLKPDLDKQYFLLGIIDKEEHKSKTAISFFKKALENNSKNYKALFELALTSDSYYKDKKIAFDLYERYINKFEKKNIENTNFAQERIEKLKKELFLDGVVLD